MSQTRYLKSMITPTLVEPTENHEAGVASGVWSTQDQLEARRGGVWPEAGVANPDSLIENNFSTYIYSGDSSAGNETTGIDLVNNKGLIWLKWRSGNNAFGHALYDTVRGKTKQLKTETAAVESTESRFTGFREDGFSLSGDTELDYAGGGSGANKYLAWTFKAAPKFFDVVTYTGSGSAKTVAHSLGSTVGMILIKNRGETDNWAVYHRANTAAPQTDYLILNTTAATADSADWWNDTAPTTSVFTVGTDHAVNADGENYVAYLFAHETGDDSMIQCGTYEGNGGTQEIDLGFEPQWVMIKSIESRSYQAALDWNIFDSMREFANRTSGDNDVIVANESEAEAALARCFPTAKGFKFYSDGAYSLNTSGDTYIYVAIRRPNMATITDATKVFAVDSGENSSDPRFTSDFPVDFAFVTQTTGSTKYASARLIQTRELLLNGANAEGGGSNYNFTFNNGWVAGSVGNDFISYMWKRAKGYFDVVCYTGTGSALNVSHGLGVAPEMMWIKNRGVADNWAVYYGDNTDYLILNTTAATADSANWWNDTSPTTSVFTVNTDHSVNASGEFYTAFLFATLAGVSKVGSVTHSGSSTDVDCGFTSGARFVLLKRIDASGDWFFWDSTNGIIAGNDPYLLLNDDAAQVTNTDFIDPLSSGFQISGSFQDGDYIFYAIA